MPNLSNKSVVRALRLLPAAILVLAGLWGLSLASTPPTANAQSSSNQPTIVRLNVDGAIDAVSSRFIKRGLEQAEDQQVALVVIVLDTPGGLLYATRDIVEDILVSAVPVAVYVAPEGAQAASAGTFIGAAADILAMATATNIGAASVVGPGGEELPGTVGEKAEQDAAAFIRSIADRRGRDVAALEDTVISATAYSASEAVDLGVADLVAPSYDELIRMLDGVEIANDGDVTVLELTGANTVNVDFTLVEHVLSFLANPNVAFLLVSLGGLGLIVELWNPGLWIPGTLGVLFLVLGWAGVGQLPFSWAGIALLVLAGLLFYLESTAVGIGYFGIAGTGCLILGGIFLVGFFGSPSIPGDAPTVSRWLLGSVGVIIGGLVLWFASELRKARDIDHYESPTISSNLVGAVGVAQGAISPTGQVLVNGEFWSGEADIDSSGGIADGTEVEVVSVDGNHLMVKPLRTEESARDVSNIE